MPLAPGTLLRNRYRIVSILGQGGMGAVYRANDEHLGIPVAVKENLFLTEEYGRQFQREAHILASLRHSNLPHVTDYFSLETQVQYLVMDYVEGEDLRQRMERMGSLPEREAMLIGISTCEALTYLHTRRPAIVHRDLKPGNIKVTPDGQAVLVDFGLAKVMAGEQVTSTGARAMTPGYSPPEQYGTARTDPRSDIYSLGATLYAALTGVIPEDGLARVTGKSKLTPVRELSPKVGRRLAETIERAMELDPDDRFQTAEEFKRSLIECGELAPFYQERPSIPPPPSTATNGLLNDGSAFSEEISSEKRRESRSKRRRRQKALAWITVGVLALLVVTGVSLLVFVRPDLARPVLAYLALPVAAAERTQVGAEYTVPATSTISLNETPQASTQAPAPAQGGSPEPTVASPISTPTIEPSATLMPTITISPSPTPTPRGGGPGQIAYVSNRDGTFQIYTMNSDGSNRNQITSLGSGACQPDWSPDGTKIVFTSPCPDKKDLYENSSLFVVDINTPEKAITQITKDFRGDFDPAWSPDGKRIAFTSIRSGRAAIWLINLDDLSTEPIPLTDPKKGGDKQPAWNPRGMQIAFVRQFGTISQIWWMRDDGMPQNQFSVSGDVLDIWPSWSVDGETIFYSQMSVDSTVPRLVSQRFEDWGKSRETIIPINPKNYNGPYANVRQSPDGQWLVYESWPSNPPNHDIYVMSRDGSNPLRLTRENAYDFDPVWRPAPTPNP